MNWLKKIEEIENERSLLRGCARLVLHRQVTTVF